ncbi:MAG: GAF domain-containing protein [Planctomycetes bacterium]|nr:GAF domain-containing protein [Planctomycetota bacterium]
MADRDQAGDEEPRFDEVLVRLSRDLGLGADRFEHALARITEVAAEILMVDRSSVWKVDEELGHLVCLDLYDRHSRRHDLSADLAIDGYGSYFEALDDSRIIDAADARLDPRTSAFTESYLDPAGITAMLDAPIRLRGEIVGVICNEMTGGPRVWNRQEAAFAASLGDLLATVFEAHEREELQRQFLRSQKLEAVGRLAGGVAHDFNNVLTAIRGNLDLIDQILRLHPMVRGEVAGELDHMQSAIERAAALTRQLLTFSGRRTQGDEPFDASEVVADMETMLRRLLPESIDIRMEIADTPAALCTDPTLVEQILLNLVLNARDAMPRGGTLVIETTVVRVGEVPCWRLLVRDTGVGIAPAVREFIFEPFFSTKDEGKGSGLGLSTVQGIVRSMGGSIAVESVPDEGATFIVRLPLCTRADSQATNCLA